MHFVVQIWTFTAWEKGCTKAPAHMFPASDPRQMLEECLQGTVCFPAATARTIAPRKQFWGLVVAVVACRKTRKKGVSKSWPHVFFSRFFPTAAGSAQS